MTLARTDPPGIGSAPQPGADAAGEHQGGAAARAFAARHGLLRSLCTRERDGTLLDVGCGRGQDLLALAPHMALGVGVDASANAVQLARLAAMDALRRNLRFAVGNAVAFRVDAPVPDRYDLVVVRGGDDLGGFARSLRAARQRLAPQGRIVVLGTDERHPAVAWRHWCLGLKRSVCFTPDLVRELAGRLSLDRADQHALPWHPEPLPEDLAPRPGLVRKLSGLAGLCPGGSFALVLRPH